MTKHQLETPKGYPISVSAYHTESPSDYCIIIASATGVKQTLYTKISMYFAENGFHVYTFDYGGIGDSKTQHLKQFDTTARDWAENDLNAVIEFVQQQNPSNQIFFMGHSIGGQLIGITPSNKAIKGMVLVAAQTGYWKLWQGMNKLRMFAVWHLLIPVLTRLFSYFPAKKIGSSEDLPKSMALEWAKWAKSPNYLFDHLPHAQQQYNQMTCPVVSYSASDDNYAPKITVDWLTKKLENTTAERKHIKPDTINIKKLGHFGFFRSANKDKLWPVFLADFNKMKK